MSLVYRVLKEALRRSSSDPDIQCEYIENTETVDGDTIEQLIVSNGDKNLRLDVLIDVCHKEFRISTFEFRTHGHVNSPHLFLEGTWGRERFRLICTG